MLGAGENVGYVLILAQQRNVKKNLQRFGIGGQDDEFGLASVQSLGCLVGALPKLLVVARLLDQVENFRRQGGFGEGVGLRVDFFGLQMKN